MVDEQGTPRHVRPDKGPPIEPEQMKYRVLFVTTDSDDTTISTALRANSQFTVRTVSTTGALERVTTDDVDCIVIECRLDDDDGLDTLTDGQRERPLLPFILVSDEAIAGRAGEALEAGATDYVHQPANDNADLLAHRIRAAVDSETDDQRGQKSQQNDFYHVYRALETAQEGISLLDENGEFVYVNQAYADLYGYDADEMIGMHWDMIYPDDEVGRVHNEILPDVDEGGNWSGETTGLRADGSTFIEEHSLSKTADGGLVCTIRDITEKRKREQLVKRYRSVVDDVFGESAVGVVILDPSFEVTWTNRAIKDYFGLTGRTIEGREMTELIDRHLKQRVAEPETFAAQVTSAYEENDSVEEFEIRVELDDGRDERYLQHRSQPIEAGEYAGGRIELYFDVTERKKREKQLEQFADVVSHDLRSPLSIAQMYIGEARRDGNEADFDEVERAHSRMETIIENLLSMARANQSLAGRSPVSLEAVAKQAWEQTKTENASIHIEDAERTVSAYEDRLQAAFENLFRNAVEHGGTDVDIRIGTFDDGFYVTDSGPGIPPEKQAEVFEYGHSGSGGTGLGLAIVRDVMDAHGWDINITEATNGGDMFEIKGVEFNSTGEQVSK